MSMEKNLKLIAEQFKTFSNKQKIAFITFVTALVLLATAYLGHFFYFMIKGQELCHQVCIYSGKASGEFVTTKRSHERKGCYCYDERNNKVRWADYDFLGYPVSKGAGVYSWLSSLFSSDEK
jgi:hypothetical protein